MFKRRLNFVNKSTLRADLCLFLVFLETFDNYFQLQNHLVTITAAQIRNLETVMTVHTHVCVYYELKRQPINATKQPSKPASNDEA